MTLDSTQLSHFTSSKLNTINDKKKSIVAVIVPWPFIPPTNGGQKVCHEFCLALATRTRVVCFSTHRENSLHGLKLIPFFSSSVLRYFNVYLILKLARALKKNDVSHCIVNQPFFVFFAFLACKLARCQLITYAHNLEFKRSDGLRRYLRPAVFLLEFFAFHLSRRVFFISNAELIEARKRFHLAPCRCVFVPHIIRDSFPASTLRSPQSQPYTLVFFGNFSYPPNRRGLDALFQHIVPLLDQRLSFPCRLVIFGRNIPGFLESRQSSPRLSVEVLGYIDNPASVIQQSDIVLSPVSEGTGVQTKIIEAIALGTTVISANSGMRGIDPVIAGGKLRWVEDSDWHGFVQMIFDIKENGLHALSTPDSFFNIYSEQAVMARILSAIRLD